MRGSSSGRAVVARMPMLVMVGVMMMMMMMMMGLHGVEASRSISITSPSNAQSWTKSSNYNYVAWSTSYTGVDSWPSSDLAQLPNITLCTGLTTGCNYPVTLASSSTLSNLYTYIRVPSYSPGCNCQIDAGTYYLRIYARVAGQVITAVSSHPIFILAADSYDVSSVLGVGDILPGQVLSLSWSTAALYTDVFLMDGSVIVALIVLDRFDNNFQWTVPAVATSDYYFVRVRSCDEHSRFADSSYFRIGALAPIFKVIYPVFGARFDSGSSIPVRWQSTNLLSTETVQVTLFNASWQLTVSGLNTGSLAFALPPLTVGEYQFMIDVPSQTYFNVSTEIFTISDVPVRVTFFEPSSMSSYGVATGSDGVAHLGVGSSGALSVYIPYALWSGHPNAQVEFWLYRGDPTEFATATSVFTSPVYTGTIEPYFNSSTERWVSGTWTVDGGSVCPLNLTARDQSLFFIRATLTGVSSASLVSPIYGLVDTSAAFRIQDNSTSVSLQLTAPTLSNTYYRMVQNVVVSWVAFGEGDSPLRFDFYCGSIMSGSPFQSYVINSRCQSPMTLYNIAFGLCYSSQGTMAAYSVRSNFILGTSNFYLTTAPTPHLSVTAPAGSYIGNSGMYFGYTVSGVSYYDDSVRFVNIFIEKVSTGLNVTLAIAVPASSGSSYTSYSARQLRLIPQLYALSSCSLCMRIRVVNSENPTDFGLSPLFTWRAMNSASNYNPVKYRVTVMSNSTYISYSTWPAIGEQIRQTLVTLLPIEPIRVSVTYDTTSYFSYNTYDRSYVYFIQIDLTGPNKTVGGYTSYYSENLGALASFTQLQVFLNNASSPLYSALPYLVGNTSTYLELDWYYCTYGRAEYCYTDYDYNNHSNAGAIVGAVFGSLFGCAFLVFVIGCSIRNSIYHNRCMCCGVRWYGHHHHMHNGHITGHSGGGIVSSSVGGGGTAPPPHAYATEMPVYAHAPGGPQAQPYNPYSPPVAYAQPMPQGGAAPSYASMVPPAGAAPPSYADMNAHGGARVAVAAVPVHQPAPYAGAPGYGAPQAYAQAAPYGQAPPGYTPPPQSYAPAAAPYGAVPAGYAGGAPGGYGAPPPSYAHGPTPAPMGYEAPPPAFEHDHPPPPAFDPALKA